MNTLKISLKHRTYNKYIEKYTERDEDEVKSDLCDRVVTKLGLNMKEKKFFSNLLDNYKMSYNSKKFDRLMKNDPNFLKYYIENKKVEDVKVGSVEQHLYITTQSKALRDLQSLQESYFWISSEIDPSKDKKDWDSLDEDQKRIVENVIIFFLVGDSLINHNIQENFLTDIDLKEFQIFLDQQKVIENTHKIVYSNFAIELMGYDRVVEESKRLEDHPAIRPLLQFMKKYMDKQMPFAVRLVAFSLVESVFFQPQFAVVYWLKLVIRLCREFGYANQLISKDEKLHTVNAVMAYYEGVSLGKFPALSPAIILMITQECVNAAVAFIMFTFHRGNVSSKNVHSPGGCNVTEIKEETMGEEIKVDGISKDSLTNYTKYVADTMLKLYKCPKHYHTDKSLDYLDFINLEKIHNFFEVNVGDYCNIKNSVILNENKEEQNDF